MPRFPPCGLKSIEWTVSRQKETFGHEMLERIDRKMRTKRIIIYTRNIILLILLVLLIRKFYLCVAAISYVRSWREESNELHKSNWFFKLQKAVTKVSLDSDRTGRYPKIMVLNQFATNITLNFLCNLAAFPRVEESVILICLDKQSCTSLQEFSATEGRKIEVIQAQVPGLSDRAFKHVDGPYQLFQVFRAELAASLLEYTNSSFWMIQADTLWFNELKAPHQETELDSCDISFDTAGYKRPQSGQIAGGYFFVRNTTNPNFFRKLSKTLGWLYAPDNAILGHLCHQKFADTRCCFISYDIVANWQWFHLREVSLPTALQFDNGEGSSRKLERMTSLGMLFLSSHPPPSCNSSVSLSRIISHKA